MNAIKAGVATDSLETIRKVELVLLAIPETQLDGWVAQICESKIDWAGVSFVVCSGARDSTSLKALRNCGASTASLDKIDLFEGKRYLFEGSKVALHRLRRLVEKTGAARIVPLNDGMRAVYEAGLTFASGMTFPMIAAAVDTMRAAGLHSKIAEGVVETAVLGAVRSYLRAGKRGWTGPIAMGDRVAMRKQYQGLFDVEPVLAEMYLKIALDYLVERVPTVKRRRQKPQEY
ncbi:DUF2520 domain-containing protein [Bryobacter aggregatus]|uniref:DUF2520 domain-containing protein n=1 Tax=Bryobacter aggregatus TaxID=360054 RepID=UPI001EE1DAEB|nr:DUF2520 domain-containing protein [Bryobacter aggregatus]